MLGTSCVSVQVRESDLQSSLVSLIVSRQAGDMWGYVSYRENVLNTRFYQRQTEKRVT